MLNLKTLRGAPGLLGLSALLLSGCPADPSEQITCGPDTKLENGECVSTIEPAPCADGTVRNPDTGRCEPEAACGPGTSYDPVSGACEPDTECGPDTTFNPETGLCEPNVVCGDDTTFNVETGLCEPNTVCGEGTRLDEETGECVPDEGNCGDGTHFDPATGQCLPDLVCGPGLVPVDGVCLSAMDLLVVEADAIEPEADANDPAFDGTPEAIALEPEGERTVFTGVISRPADRDGDGAADQDVDLWRFTGAAGQLLRITVSTGGSFQPAFVVTGPNDYYRETQTGFAIDAQRQVVLPYDGEYDVKVIPSLVLQGVSDPIGDPAARYAGVIEALPLPTPAEVAVPDDGSQVSAAGNLFELADNMFAIVPSEDAPVVLEVSVPVGETEPALVLLSRTGEVVGEGAGEVPFRTSGEVRTAQNGSYVRLDQGVIAVLDWRSSTGNDGTFELKATRIGNVDIGAVGAGEDLLSRRHSVLAYSGVMFSFAAEAGQIVMSEFEGISANVTLLSPSNEVIYSGGDVFYEAIFHARETGTYRWMVINSTANDSDMVAVIRSYTPHVLGPVDGTTVQTASFAGDKVEAAAWPTGEWFLVENTGPALVEFSWDWWMGAPYMDVYGLDDKGFVVERRWSPDDDPYTLRRLALAPGYTLARLDPGTTGGTPSPSIVDWQVDIAVHPVPSLLEAEPNDTVDTAQAITGEGLRLGGEIGDEEHDVFLYTLETPLAPGEALRVQAEVANLDFTRVDLNIRAPGTTLSDDPLYERDTAPTGEWYLLPSDGPGPFVIELEGVDSQGDRSMYVLAIDRVQIGQAEAEPNDTPATANAVGAVALADFPVRMIGVAREGEPDVFAVTLAEPLPAGSALRVRADNLNEIGDLLVEVLDAGEAVLSDADHEDSHHLVPVLGTGPIYVQVQGDSTVAEEQYRVTIDVVSPVEVEPNNEIGNATPLPPLAPGGVVEMWGADVEHGVDIYRIDLDTPLEEGEALAFRWTFTVDPGNIDGAVLDAAGTVIASTDKYVGTIFAGEAGATGPYYLRLIPDRSDADTFPEIYRVEVERISGVALEAEPNDDFATANPLTLPASLRALSYDQDDDVFSVTLPEDLVGGEKLIIDGFVPYTTDDVIVRVLVDDNPDGEPTELAATTDILPYLEVDLPLTAAGSTYFIVVQGDTALLTDEREVYELDVSIGVP